MASKKSEKKEQDSFVPLQIEDTRVINVYNPLRTITTEQIKDILDSARCGAISRLQLMYDLVEQSSLTLGMCITRRTSALPDWTIKPRDMKRVRDFDEGLAKEQMAFLMNQFAEAENSGTFLPALNTLQMSVFRGIGVVQPIYDQEGNLKRFLSLDPWNFAISPTKDDLGRHILYWNPRGKDILHFDRELKEIPNDQIVVNMMKNPIDSHALVIYLAEQLGFESYNQLIARKGLPAAWIIAPESLPQDKISIWARKAADVAKGGSGAFPFGTDIITHNIDASNASAIQEFLDYQEKKIVLASTGGTLTSLASPTGLGSNIADIQNDVFKTIVRGDARTIGDLINRSVANRLLDRFFPGKQHLVYFDLAQDETKSVKEYLEDAVLAKNAGLVINIDQLCELTNYKLERESNIEPSRSLSDESLESDNGNIHPEENESTERIVDESLNVVETEQESDSNETEEEEKRDGAELLVGFDRFLEPLRAIMKKLVGSGKKDEEQLIEDAKAMISKLESQEENDYTTAVENLMVREFEKEAEELKEETQENK